MDPTVHLVASCPTFPELVATALDGVVSVWSADDGKLHTRFPATVDFGGDRLALAALGGSAVVVAASYDDGVVTAYDALAGAVLWRVRIPRPQRVSDLGGGLVAVGAEHGPLRVLALDRGRGIATLRGVAAAYGDGGGAWILAAGRSKTVDWRTVRGEPVWEERLDGFAVLDAAVGPDAVVWSEAGASVHCRTRGGSPLWSYVPPPGVHALVTEWSRELDAWVVLLQDYETGAPPVLATVDRAGDLVETIELERTLPQGFLPGGLVFVDQSGVLRAVPDGGRVGALHE